MTKSYKTDMKKEREEKKEEIYMVKNKDKKWKNYKF